LRELISLYSNALKKNTIPASKVNYGFDYMSNGDYISPTLRRAYACVVDELPLEHDPFDSIGVVGKFAKRNNLIENNYIPYSPKSFVDIEINKRKFVVLNWFMKAALKILGPNRFTNFSRLLVYLSSYRQNRDLWKL
jgi:hypothetical protein